MYSVEIESVLQKCILVKRLTFWDFISWHNFCIPIAVEYTKDLIVMQLRALILILRENT